jgi:hypothetical protein
MAINVRTKGQQGEREVADLLNFTIYTVMKEMGYNEEESLRGMTTVQRNQQQSAVGGNDLTNCFGLSIEVKRQEQLSVNTWWKQCVLAAERNSELPVLMYRQNRKPWRIRTLAWLNVGSSSKAYMQAVVEFDIDTFKSWFQAHVKQMLVDGYDIKV